MIANVEAMELCAHEAYEVDSSGQAVRCNDCGQAFSALSPSPAPSEQSEVDQAIRTAVWNVCRGRGMGDDESIAFVRKVLAEPVLAPALRDQDGYRRGLDDAAKIAERIPTDPGMPKHLLDAHILAGKQIATRILALKGDGR